MTPPTIHCIVGIGQGKSRILVAYIHSFAKHKAGKTVTCSRRGGPLFRKPLPSRAYAVSSTQQVCKKLSLNGSKTPYKKPLNLKTIFISPSCLCSELNQTTFYSLPPQMFGFSLTILQITQGPRPKIFKSFIKYGTHLTMLILSANS